MRRAFLLASVLALSACEAQRTVARPLTPPRARAHAPSEPSLPLEESLTIRHYDVTGTTLAEVRRDMLEKAPVLRGQRAAGTTEWIVSWSFPVRPGARGCATGPPDVKVRIEQVLPRWVGEDRATPAHRQAWTYFLEMLREHEDQHRKHGLLAGHAIRKALPALAPRPTCDEMAETANAEGKRIAERFAQEDAAFDAGPGKEDFTRVDLRRVLPETGFQP